MNILVATTWESPVRERHLEEMRAAAQGSNLVLKRHREVTHEEWLSTDVIMGYPDPELIRESRRLMWLQIPFAGVERYRDLPAQIQLTNASGVYGVPIAEWIVGVMLMLTRRLHLYRDQQHNALWKEQTGAREIMGSTVGIVGLGDIGREAALRVKAMGCRVLGVRRTRAALPPGIDALMPLDELLPQADFLVLALPSTPETTGLISAQQLSRMKRGAYLLNVGRGSAVDEPALIEALRFGHLAGAGLDVTAEEPLPPESPLWQMENAILTPHVSSHSPEANADRRNRIYCENLRRFLSSRPLLNLVDRAAGY